MIRYWFEFNFSNNDIPRGLVIGCGVTAHNCNDAIDLIQSKISEKITQPDIKKITENVDISTLDANHILPNMSPPNIRGVWFPLGYQ